MSVWDRIERRVRRLLGRGWGASEFIKRYAANYSDAWGYRGNPAHAERSRRVLEGFRGSNPQRLLELGCAEGFLTLPLRQLAGEVVSCDLSAEAVSRAAFYCSGMGRGEFCVMDVRNELPLGPFDGCLASDVLYYLSPAEIRKLARKLHLIMPAERRFVFANEWNTAYRDLTAPLDALACLTEGGNWVCESSEQYELGAGHSHFLAVLR